ncbi:hypothetical protein PanWU01x14_367480, partial [Parasponia andersonii]
CKNERNSAELGIAAPKVQENWCYSATALMPRRQVSGTSTLQCPFFAQFSPSDGTDPLC